MKPDLTDIFEAETLEEAQLLATRLKEAGIKSFIDNTDSPLDGLTAAAQFKVVRVLPKDEKAAREVASEFLAESMGDADFSDLDLGEDEE
jgi:hypothetical protein